MTAPDDWTARCRAVLARYPEPLLRAVATRLVKARTTQPADDLLDKAVATLANAPVIDRRVRDLPPASRALLALVGLSRQPRWKVGHLLTLLAALGHAEGFAPVQDALDSGLLFPELPAGPVPDDFAAWLGEAGTLNAMVFAHPAVTARVRGDELGLPDLSQATGGARPPLAKSPARHADGLEWPLRLAAVWQQVFAGPVRLTQANALFKRDLTRLQTDAVLNAPAADHIADPPEPGVLALYWAAAAGLLAGVEGELRAGPFPPEWDAGLTPLLGQLAAALPLVETWDPLAGYAPGDDGLSPVPTAGLLALLLLARVEPAAWVEPAAIADWLWTHHPTWAGAIPKGDAATRGARWVANWLFGVAYQLGLIEAPNGGEPLARLSALGRHLFADGPAPPPPPAFPQTLLVQPNAEVLAYRQGLTPSLIATLSRFAGWKGIGPACTLELTPEQTYHGLESGLTLPMMLQALNRHATRPVPPAVADLLQRWANKRDRITVFTSAVLVEFPTPADLDAAVARGVVSVRLTDRIGMTPDGAEPGLTQLRLIANRDFEAKPQRCVTVSDDGVTLTVDAAQADLLLEAEIVRFADPLPGDVPGVRRFRLSPQSLRRAADQGLLLADLDTWFADRTGDRLSPAGRLFLLGGALPPPAVAQRLVVRFATPEITDGVVQWPETSRLVAERLGPTALVVEGENLEAFRQVLGELGISLA